MYTDLYAVFCNFFYFLLKIHNGWYFVNLTFHTEPRKKYSDLTRRAAAISSIILCDREQLIYGVI